MPEFHIPNMPGYRMSYAYSKKGTRLGFMSILLVLAEQGFLTIHHDEVQNEGKSPWAYNIVNIHREREYPGWDPVISKFWQRFFRGEEWVTNDSRDPFFNTFRFTLMELADDAFCKPAREEKRAVKGFQRELKRAGRRGIPVGTPEEAASLFYRILPSAYAVGCELEWGRAFRDLRFATPDWYYGYEDCDGEAFVKYISGVLYSLSHDPDTNVAVRAAGLR